MVNEDSIDHWAGSGAVFVSVCLCVSPIPRAQGSIQVRVKVSRMAIGSLHLASNKYSEKAGFEVKYKHGSLKREEMVSA